MSRSMVVIELADHPPFARDLSAGGVFVPACALRLAEECDLVVCGVTHQMMIPARVVYVDPRGAGAGLELLGFSPEMKAQLADLATAMPVDPPPEPAEPAPEPPPPDDDDLHSGFTEPIPLDDADPPDDDLEIPSLFGRAPTGAPETDEPAVPAVPEPDEEDLAIPVSAEAAYISSVPPPEPTASGEPVFSYGRPGVTVRIGVLRPASQSDADEPRLESRLESRIDTQRDLASGTRQDVAVGTRRDVGADTRRDLPGIGPDDDPAAELALADLGDPDPDASLELDLIDPLDPDSLDGPDAGDDADDPSATGSRRGARRIARNVHERLRGLPLAAQVKLAAQGELHERIVLERLYGKNVWETLLRNPRLTAPEVARIARMGALPRVLLEILVANNAWLQIPEVRRALLANPRLATDQIVKVLRLTPKHELKLAAIQTAYPYAVRNAAKMLLRGE